MRGGGEVGRIRFKHDSLQGNADYVFPDSGFPECDHSSYSDIPVSVFLHALEEFVTAAERVYVAPEMQVPAILHNFQEIQGCVAQVNVDRKVPLRRQLQLGAEGFFLLGLEFLAPVVVEPDLAHGNHSFLPVR